MAERYKAGNYLDMTGEAALVQEQWAAVNVTKLAIDNRCEMFSRNLYVTLFKGFI